MKTSSLDSRAIFLAVLAGAVLSLGACGKGAPAGAPGGKDATVARPSPYATIASGKVDVDGGVIEVAARRFGVIKEVLVQEGAVVKKGQVLARQDDQDSVLAVSSAQAAVAQAESQVALTEVNIRTAQREHDRLARLAASNLVAQQQLDQASDAIATAQAQLGTQRAAILTARAQLAQAE